MYLNNVKVQPILHSQNLLFKNFIILQNFILIIVNLTFNPAKTIKYPLKQLLTIISILVFSNPVIGEKYKVETLYPLGEFPDWEWVKNGDKKTLPNYQGQVKDGKPNGHGVLISTNGWKYFGSWNNGEIWNGTEYDNYGNIIFIWVEGKRRYHNLNKSY